MLLSLIPSLLVLGFAAAVALRLSTQRSSPENQIPERNAASVALAIATAVQGVHFLEETVTDLPSRLGALVGVPEMPFAFFIVFNVSWLLIWIVSVWGIRTQRRTAFFAAWFLAIAALFNAIAHPMLAIAAGGYFPGLVTSPIIGVAGYRLWRRLHAATDPLSTVGMA